ncbi:unnamed protein product [Durusdinium trenchii]|uniref:Uncharacterized protein n=1 Tax=Durusdinium trenchii TaxID=1381693 RepID=A0ABP0KSH4_9DINO
MHSVVNVSWRQAIYVWILRYNERRIAQINHQQEEGFHNSRTSRLAKWREVAERARKDLQLPPGALETLKPGNIVLFHTPSRTSSVETGMILSVWRGVKMPKLICGDTPINSVVAFRAVQLQLESASEERLESTIWLQNKRYSLLTLQNDRKRVYESVWIYSWHSWSFFRVWVFRVADVGGSRTCWP